MADISKLKPNGATGTEYNIIDDDYRNTDHTFTMNTYSSYSHTFEDTQISQRMPVRNVFTGIQSLFNSVKTAINDHGSLFGDIATALAFRVTKDNATYKALNFHSYDHTIDDSMELTTQFDGAGEMGCVWFTNTNLGVITDAVNDHAEWIAKETAGSKTVTGNPLTITDASPIKAEKIEIDFDPKQDKHGYGSVWVGGAGKNKCRTTLTSQTKDGVTYTVNSDGSIAVSGTPTSYANVDAGEAIVNSSMGNVTFSAFSESTNIIIDVLYVRDSNGTSLYRTENINNTLTINLADYPTAAKITFSLKRASNGVKCSGVVKPQIELGSTATPFEPYSNICPIQGYSEVNVDDWGKNFLKLNGEKDSSNSITLTPVRDSSGNAIKMRVQGTATANVNRGIGKLVSNLNRRIKFVIDSVPSGISRFYLWDNTTGTMAKDNIVNGTEHTISNDHSYAFAITIPNGNSVNGDIQAMAVNADETDLNFVPYKTLTVQVGNKNLIPNTISGLKTANTNGTWTGNSYVYNGITVTVIVNVDNNIIGYLANGTSTGQFIFYFGGQTLKANVSYTLTGCPSGGASNTYRLANIGGDIAINDFGQGGSAIPSADVTTSMAIYIPSSGVAINNLMFYPMLRYSYIESSEFSPYNPSLGDMIYGGKLTILQDGSADVDVTHGILDLGTRTWIYQSTYTRFYVSYSDMAITPNDQVADAWCSGYNMVSANDVVSPNNGVIGLSQSKNIIIRNTDYTDPDLFKASLNGITLAYPLATPFTLHLSPVETLTLLQGINNVWTDGTTLSLTYQPDNAIGEAKGDVQEVMDYAQEIARDNYSRNLFNKDNLENGAYQNSQSHRYQVVTYVATCFIPVIVGETITISGMKNWGTALINCFVDLSKAYIEQVAPRTSSGGYAESVTVVVPDNASYLAMACYIGTDVDHDLFQDKDTIQVERGTQATYYEPYIPTNKELGEMVNALASTAVKVIAKKGQYEMGVRDWVDMPDCSLSLDKGTYLIIGWCNLTGNNYHSGSTYYRYGCAIADSSNNRLVGNTFKPDSNQAYEASISTCLLETITTDATVRKLKGYMGYSSNSYPIKGGIIAFKIA